MPLGYRPDGDCLNTKIDSLGQDERQRSAELHGCVRRRRQPICRHTVSPNQDRMEVRAGEEVLLMRPFLEFLHHAEDKCRFEEFGDAEMGRCPVGTSADQHERLWGRALFHVLVDVARFCSATSRI